MARKKVSWILVADGKEARIYGNDGPGKGLYRATDRDFRIELPEKTHDIMSDREGRAINPGSHSPQTISPRTDPRDHLAAEFLHNVAAELDAAGDAGLFDRLILIAPPKALGVLRAALGKHTAALVTKDLDKDFVHMPQRNLEQRLIDAGIIL